MIRFLLFILLLNCFFLAGKLAAQDSESNRDKQHTVPAGRQVIDSLKKVIADVEKQCPEPCNADTGRINAYNEMGMQFYKQNPDSALALFKEAEKTAEKLCASSLTTSLSTANTAKKYLANALNNIGAIYKSQGDIPKALEYYNKSLSITEAIEDKDGMADSFNNIGIIYYNQGDIPKVLEYFNKSLCIREEIGDKDGTATSLSNIGAIYYNQGDIPSALEYFNKSISLKEEIGDKDGMANSLNNIGAIYVNQGDIPGALEYFNKSLSIKEEIGDKKGMALSFNNIGAIYVNQGDVPKALEFHNKSLSLYEEMADKQGMASSFNNIGGIYNDQGDIPKALEYYNKSLSIREEIGNKKGMADSFNNIGIIYDIMGDRPKALEHFNKSLGILEEIGDKKGMAGSFNNIGSIYKDQGDLLKALEYYNKSLKINEEIGSKYGVTYSLYNLGWLSQKQKKVLQFETYALKCYELSKELGFPKRIELAASLMKDLMVSQGNYKRAYEYYQEQIAMRDSVQNEENYKQTQKQQARYEYQKQAAVDSVAHNKAMEIKDLSLAKKEEETKRQQVVIYSFIAGFVIIIVFSILLFRMFLQKKKANIKLAQQNDEIAAQRDEIETQRDLVTEQRDHIEEIHQEITDSITYAKRIQSAVLPALTTLSGLKILTGFESFVLFRPHSVVSGDYFWATKTEEWTIVTVADCTGHGVPGAFMSMLGVSFLNEIVLKKDVTNTAEILNHLRTSVIEALKQTGEQGTQKDGMDMSIIAIHNLPAGRQETKKALWAGANNPLYIVRPKKQDPNTKTQEPDNKKDSWGLELETLGLEFKEYKGDSMPVAVHVHMEPFTNYEIALNKGDLLYLFTDGFPDQFGGPKGKKFKYKPFKRLLVENSNKPMSEQKEALESALDNWMNYDSKVSETGGDNTDSYRYEQVDDITVVGLIM